MRFDSLPRAAAMALLLTALAACDDAASAVDTAPADGGADGVDPAAACALPQHADDILLAYSTAITLPKPAYAATSLGSRYVVVCGDAFAAVVDTAARAVVSKVEDPRLAGQCTGVSGNGTDRIVLVTGAGSIALLGVAAGKLSVLASAARAAWFYDVFVDATTAWVAAGAAGVLRYSLSGDALDGGASVPGAKDARSVRKVGANLVVADGAVAASDWKKPSADGGGEIRLISVSGSGALATVTGLAGVGARLVEAGAGRVIVLRRGEGFDVLTVTDTTLTATYSQTVKLGAPLAGVVKDDSLVLATGSHVVRFRLRANEAERISIEARPIRGDPSGPLFRTVVAAGGATPSLWTLMTDRLVATTLGAGEPAPHIHLEQWTHTLDKDTPDALVRIHNIGNAPLIVEGTSAPPPFSAGVSKDYATPRPKCPTQWVVPPGEVIIGTYNHDGQGAATSAKVTVKSNDPDEREMQFAVQYERPAAKVGDTPLDFDLTAVSGAHVKLSDYQGKVVLIKLYNPT